MSRVLVTEGAKPALGCKVRLTTASERGCRLRTGPSPPNGAVAPERANTAEHVRPRLKLPVRSIRGLDAAALAGVRWCPMVLFESSFPAAAGIRVRSPGQPRAGGVSGACAALFLVACGGEEAAAPRETRATADADGRSETDGRSGADCSPPACGPGAADAALDVPPAAAPASAAASGHAFNFASGGGTLVGGVVTLLERPGVSATTGDDAAFTFEALPVGAETTFVLSYADYPPIQTGTHVLPAEGMARVSFQAPSRELYDVLTRLLQVSPAADRCQIATTVTRVGNSLYDDSPGTHGEPGATVTLEPIPADVDGPVYFNLARYNVIWPDRALTETTADGGVLFLNVPEGEYTLVAHKTDTDFRPVKIKCRAGYVANASPPWGLQAISGGVGPRSEPDWQ